MSMNEQVIVELSIDSKKLSSQLSKTISNTQQSFKKLNDQLVKQFEVGFSKINNIIKSNLSATETKNIEITSNVNQLQNDIDTMLQNINSIPSQIDINVTSNATDVSTNIENTLSQVDSNALSETGKNVVNGFVDGMLSNISSVLDVGDDILKSLGLPFEGGKDMLMGKIEEVLSPVKDFASNFSTILPNFDGLKTTFDELSGVFEKVKSFTGSDTFSGITTGVTTFVSKLKEGNGVLSAFSAVFPSLGGAINNVWTAITVFFSGLQEGLGVFGSLQTVLPTGMTSFSALGETLLGLINPVTLIVAGIMGLVAGFIYLYTTSESFREQINGIFTSILENVTGVITGIITILQTIWTLGLEPMINSTIEAFQNLWDNGLSTFVANVSIFVLSIIDLIMSIWNNAINPFIELLLTILLPVFTTVWDALLAIAVPIIEKIMGYVNSFIEVLNIVIGVLSEHVFPIFKVVFEGVSELIKGFWGFVKPIFNFLIDILGSVVSFMLDYFLAPITLVFNTLVNIIRDLAGPISEVFDGIKGIFQGVIDFVTGVFSGDWGRAWDGVVGIFNGIVDTIVGIFKIPINGVISIINSAIESINGLGFTIPDWVPLLGGQEFRPNIPKIPLLAQGGYVKPNQPQLAMIGDNRHQGEIIAPENKMLDIVNMALENQKEKTSTDGIDILISLIKDLILTVQNVNLKVDIDSKKLSVLLDNAKKERQMIGG